MKWTVSPEAYSKTKEKIAKINARAEKKGFTGRFEVTGEKRTVVETQPNGLKKTEVVYDVEIIGDAPSYNGWTFLASLDFDPDAGLIVNTAPGTDVAIDRDNVSPGKCDHCNIDRFRRHYYVVRNDVTGEQLQVGSTCIKDFLGWQGSISFVSTQDVESELDDLYSGGSFERRYSPETVIAAAWAAIQVDGFKPAYNFGGCTKDTVVSILDPINTKVARANEEDYGSELVKSNDQAKVILDWLLSDEFKANSDYAINLKNLAGAETVGIRHVGFLASAPQTWARAQERDLTRKAENAELINEWVGEIKDRIETEVKIKSIRYFDSDWGSTTLYTLVATSGEFTNHVFKWFSSSGSLGDKTGDATYKIKGTIKKHDEYSGLRSTVLTRCKVLN